MSEFNDSVVSNIIEKGFEVNIKNALSEGWSLCTKNIGYYIGYSVLFFIIAIFGNIVSLLPFIGGIVYSFMITGLGLGYYVFTIKSDVEKQDFSYFFQGWQFLGQTLLYQIILWIFMVPLIILFIFSIPFNFSDIFNQPFGGFDSDFGVELSGIMFLFVGIFIVIQTFIYLIYLFTKFLIVGHKAQFWQAMEGSRKVVMNKMGEFFLFIIVLFLINLGGMLLLGLGLIVTFPWSLCATYAMYKSIFGGTLASVLDERISSFGENQ